jgi:hypothetical protein
MPTRDGTRVLRSHLAILADRALRSTRINLRDSGPRVFVGRCNSYRIYVTRAILRTGWHSKRRHYDFEITHGDRGTRGRRMGRGCGGILIGQNEQRHSDWWWWEK